jgi:ADP-ribose pyrophosphatase YjhB (NUDIX family)
MSRPAPQYCEQCGSPLTATGVQSPSRSHTRCPKCGHVAYRNPLILVSTIVAMGDEVLLCRRAMAPAVGRWAPPGGFLECDESLEDAATREVVEETGITFRSEDLRLHAISTLTHINEVYVGFLAEIGEASQLRCGPECLEARFFAEHDLPWTDLSYDDIGHYLRVYFREHKSGEHGIHFSKIDAELVAGRSYMTTAVEVTRRVRKT